MILALLKLCFFRKASYCKRQGVHLYPSDTETAIGKSLAGEAVAETDRSQVLLHWAGVGVGAVGAERGGCGSQATSLTDGI